MATWTRRSKLQKLGMCNWSRGLFIKVNDQILFLFHLWDWIYMWNFENYLFTFLKQPPKILKLILISFTKNNYFLANEFPHISHLKVLPPEWTEYYFRFFESLQSIVWTLDKSYQHYRGKGSRVYFFPMERRVWVFVFPNDDL